MNKLLATIALTAFATSAFANPFNVQNTFKQEVMSQKGALKAMTKATPDKCANFNGSWTNGQGEGCPRDDAGNVRDFFIEQFQDSCSMISSGDSSKGPLTVYFIPNLTTSSTSSPLITGQVETMRWNDDGTVLETQLTGALSDEQRKTLVRGSISSFASFKDNDSSQLEVKAVIAYDGRKDKIEKTCIYTKKSATAQ